MKVFTAETAILTSGETSINNLEQVTARTAEDNRLISEQKKQKKTKPHRNYFKSVVIAGIIAVAITGLFFYKNSSDTEIVISPQLRQSKDKPNKSIGEIVQEAEKKFNAFQPKIAKEHDARVNFVGSITGDITHDGVDDVVVMFVLSPKDGGNVTWGHSLVFYENLGNTVKVIGGFEASYLFEGGEIRNGNIYITKTEYADEDPHCCPSIKTPIEISVLNGKAVERYLTK
jgi:hypothetical protein